MRGAIPGTKHTTILHRHEPDIFVAMGSIPGIKKVEPLWFEHTGPRPRLDTLIGYPQAIPSLERVSKTRVAL